MMKDILVVEPNDFSLRYMVRIIERLGYGAWPSRDTSGAIRHLGRQLPDALVCGTNLTDPELFELFEALRKRSRDAAPPVIAVTSDHNGGFRERAAAQEVDEIVDRPLSVRSFFYSLEKCLNRSQRRHIRAPITIPVMVTREHRRDHYETHNFGEGGMYVKTPDPLPPGTEVDLSFSLLEGTTPFAVRGRVMHTNSRDDRNLPAGMGLKFLRTTESLRAVFTIFMENHLVLKSPVTVGMAV